jgi:ubiquinone/menaquinone biosynthesis C-methylase UbiE
VPVLRADLPRTNRKIRAQRGASVIGVDLAPALIETAKERAAQLGLEIDYRVGDCERLAVDDASFDIVSSSCGVMFAPDHAATAGELARVTGSSSRPATGRPRF